MKEAPIDGRKKALATEGQGFFRCRDDGPAEF